MDSFYDSHKSLKISDLLANNQIQLSDQVKDWYEGLNEARQSAVTLGDAMRAVGTSTLTAGTAFSKLKSIGVSVLSSLASAGLAIAASFAIGALINTITNQLHKKENTIAAGKEAQNNIDNVKKDLKTASDFNDTSAARLAKLHSGVDSKTGENVKLTNAEYQEYLGLAQQVAQIYPSVVNSFDSQGHAILNLSSNISEATKQLNDFLENEKIVAGINIGEQLDATMESALVQIGDLRDSIGDTKAEIEQIQSIESLDGILGQIKSLGDLTKPYEGGLLVNDKQYANVIAAFKEISVGNKTLYDYMHSMQPQGDQFRVWLENLPEGISFNDIIKKLESKGYMSGANADQKAASKQALLNSYENQISGIWNEVVPNILDSFMSNPNYNSLSEDITDMIAKTIYNLDPEKLTKTSTEQSWDEFFEQAYLDPILTAIDEVGGQEKFTEAIDKLLSPNFSKGKNANQFKNAVNDYLNELFSGDEYEELRKEIKVALNLTFTDENGNESWNVESVQDRIYKALGGVLTDDGLRTGKLGNIINLMDVDKLNAINDALNQGNFTFNLDKWDGTYKSLIEWVDRYIEKQKQLAEFKPEGTISDILGDENFDTQSKKYQDDITSLITALKEIDEAGKISPDTFKSLSDTFDQVFENSDDIREELSLLTVEYSDFLKEAAKTADLKPEELEKFNTLIHQIFESFGDFEIDGNIVRQKLIDALTPNLPANASDNVKNNVKNLAALRAQDILDQFGQNGEVNWQIVMEMVADGSMVKLTGDELIAEYDNRVLNWEIRVGEARKASLEIEQALDDAEKQVLESQGKEVGRDYYIRARDRAKEKFEIDLKAEKDYARKHRRDIVAGDQGVIDELNRLSTATATSENDYITSQKDVDDYGWNRRITKYENQLTDLQREAKKYQQQIDNAKNQGLTAPDELYNSLSSNASEQIKALQREQNTLIGQNNRIRIGKTETQLYNDETYQKNKDRILELQAEIDGLNNSIDNWVGEIFSNRLKPFTDALEDLQTQSQNIQDAMAFNEAKGGKSTARDYQNLIKNGDAQVANIEDQNKLLNLQLGLVRKDSQRYRDIKKQLDANKSSIRQIRSSQLDWNNSLLRLPVSNVQNLSSAIQQVLSEVDSATGVTMEAVQNLKKELSDINTNDMEGVFYRSEKGIQVDEDQLERLTQADLRKGFADYTAQIEQQRKAIADYQAQIGKGNTDEKLRGMQSNLQNLLLQQAEYYAKYQEMIAQLSDYNAAQRAKQTANAGDHYVQMQSDVEATKKMWDNGLVGTDDFKTMAAYYNAYSFAGADTFENDYSKITRYMTEDISGVTNFLTDLEAKGYASLTTLSNGTQEWKFDLGDVKTAALDMGMGFEWFMDMIGRLEDYNFANSLVTSFEQGTMKVEGLSHELAAAQMELAYLQATGADSTAIETAELKVTELENKYKSTQEALNAFNENASQNLVNNAQEALKMIESIKKEYDEAIKSGDNGLASELSTQMQNYAEEYGIKLSADLVVDKSQKQLFDKSLVSWENPLTTDDLGIIKPYYIKQFGEAFDTIKGLAQSDSEEMQGYFTTLAGHTREELEKIEFHNGDYEGAKELEDALEAIADEAGLTTDQMNILLGVLEAGGVLKTEESEARLKQLQEELQSTRDKAYELQQEGKIELSFDITEDTSGMTTEELQDEIDELNLQRVEIQSSLEMDDASKKEALDILDSLIEDRQVQISINTAIESEGGVDSLIEMLGDESESSRIISTYFTTEDGTAITDAETLQAVLEKIKANEDVGIKVHLDEKQFEALTANDRDVNVNANVTNAQTTLGELYTDMLKPHDVTVGIKLDKTTTPESIATEVQTALDTADVKQKVGLELKENAGSDLTLTDEDTPNLTAKAGVQLKEGAGADLTLSEEDTPNLTATVTATVTGTEDVQGLGDAIKAIPTEEIKATIISDVGGLNTGKTTYDTIKKDIESNPIKATIEVNEIRPGNAGNGTPKTYGEVLNDSFEGKYPHQSSQSPTPTPSPAPQSGGSQVVNIIANTDRYDRQMGELENAKHTSDVEVDVLDDGSAQQEASEIVKEISDNSNVEFFYEANEDSAEEATNNVISMAKSQLENNPAELTIEMSDVGIQETYNMLIEAQSLMAIINGTTINPNISVEEAKTRLNEIAEKLTTIDQGVQVEVGISQEGEVPTKESILQKIGSIEIPWFFKKTGDTPDTGVTDSSATTTLLVDSKQVYTEVDKAQAKINSLDGKEVDATANTGSSTDDVQELIGTIANLNGKIVIAKANVYGASEVEDLAGSINRLQNKTISIITNEVKNVITNYQTSGSPNHHTGTMTSLTPSHADGTIGYNAINYRPAYKDGKVALSKDEEALVNELGQESLIFSSQA